ncbi:variant surface antigen E-like [Patiria miniata]|uniref:Uncharacterized protein n=1 Tax=Patiria miniata TaxID=46514 RepID=A0A914AZ13_PATMI|nr:variant surface antigen E-like [Patiria miniata]XP_038068947.1 variant surface antigen E-like [Patiria miniata]XP_038068949.1 variant surface antigen E-like [Patiria miniata]
MGVGQRRGRPARRHRRRHNHHHHRTQQFGLPWSTRGSGSDARPPMPPRLRAQLWSGIIVIIFGMVTGVSFLWFSSSGGLNVIAWAVCPVIGCSMIFIGIFRIVRACQMRNQLELGTSPGGENDNVTAINMGSRVQVGQQAGGTVWATGQSGAAVLPQQAYGAAGGQMGYPSGPQTNVGQVPPPTGLQTNAGQMGYPSGPQTKAEQEAHPTGLQINTGHPGQMGYSSGLQTNAGQVGYPTGLQTNAGQVGYPTGLQTNAGQVGYPTGLQTNARHDGFPTVPQPQAAQPRFFQVQPSVQPTDHIYPYAPESSDAPPPSYDEAVQIGSVPSDK